MELTNWIAAISSAASFVVALLATVIAWRVHSSEKERQEKADQDAERSQADLVTAWETEVRITERNQLPSGILTAEQEEGFGERVDVYCIEMNIVNRSNQPVYDLIMARTDSFFSINLGILPPGEQKLMAPGYRVVDYASGSTFHGESYLSLSFRDAAEKWWVRQAKGTLVKVATQQQHNRAMGQKYEEWMKLIDGATRVDDNQTSN